MLTILFDGIAYGMLLFLIASGLAVTLGLMNFVNLAHGAFAMAGGYLAAVLSNKHGRAVPRHAAARVPLRRGARRGARADALPATVSHGRISTRCCSRSASCSWRWRPPTTSSAPTQQFVRLPPFLTRPLRDRRRGHRRCIACSSSSCARRSRSGCSSCCRARASAAACAPRSTTRASRAGSASTSTRCILATFAFGSGLAGLGGALGAEILGTRSDVSAEVHDLLPRRRGGRRHDDDHRSAGWLRCCSASPTSPASTTCRSSARSSSTA